MKKLFSTRKMWYTLLLKMPWKKSTEFAFQLKVMEALSIAEDLKELKSPLRVQDKLLSQTRYKLVIKGGMTMVEPKKQLLNV